MWGQPTLGPPLFRGGHHCCTFASFLPPDVFTHLLYTLAINTPSWASIFILWAAHWVPLAYHLFGNYSKKQARSTIFCQEVLVSNVKMIGVLTISDEEIFKFNTEINGVTDTSTEHNQEGNWKEIVFSLRKQGM